MFVGSVLGLKLRNWEPSPVANRWFGNLLLGLLGFALATSLIRTGVYALEIPAALYAVPVMLIALGSVHAARWISAYEPDARQLALMRLGGHILAGLAFAMAMAHPPATSALFSGNTLATAVLGLLLFGGSLRAERRAAYLYLSFAALFVGYFGAYDFLRDLLLPIEGPAQRLLMWAGHLPGPYRALNGLVFNLLLGILALGIAHRWRNDRLARHCHYLGVPLALAASIYSGFEPRAALICLSGYLVLDLLATWVFAAPRVQYLAIASLAGAAYFGSILLPTITLGQQAVGAAMIALACALVVLLLRGCRATRSYRLPWTHGALVLSCAGIVAATTAMLQLGVPSFLGGWCFLLVSLTAAALNLEHREEAVGYLAVISANFAGALAIVSGDLTWHWALGLDRYAMVASLCGLAEVCLAVWSGVGRGDRDAGESLRACYAWPFGHLGLILAGVAVGLAAIVPASLVGLDVVRLSHLAIAMGVSATALVIGSVMIYRQEFLAHLTVWTGLASYFCGVLTVLARAHVPHVAPTMLISLGVASLLLIEIGNRLRQTDYRRPLLYAATALAAVVIAVADLLWRPDLHVAAALAVAGLALVAILGEMPRRDVGSLALAGILWRLAQGIEREPDCACAHDDPLVRSGRGNLRPGTAGCRRNPQENAGREQDEASLAVAGTDRSRSRLFTALIPPFVIVASFVADSMAWMNFDAFRWCGFLLILAAAGLLWTSRFVRDAVLVYVGLWHAAAGFSCLSSSLYVWNSDARQVGWMALTLALIALALWIASLPARRSRLEDIYWVPCLNTAPGADRRRLHHVRDCPAHGARSLRTEHLGPAARFPGLPADCHHASLARTHLCDRGQLRCSQLHDLAELGAPGSKNGLCSRAQCGDRGSGRLGTWRCLPTAQESLAAGVCLATFPLGPDLDDPGDSARISISRDNEPGGCVVPIDREEPAGRGVDLPRTGRRGGCDLFPLARSPDTRRSDRGMPGFCLCLVDTWLAGAAR